MEKYLKLLKKSKKVALFVHISPDPDAIGSVLGLCEILENMGKTVHMFSSDEITQNYCFLERVKEFNGEFEDYDLLVAVDVTSYDRLGNYAEVFKAHSNTLRIDHHANAEGIDGENKYFPYSACAIAVLEIAQKLKVKITPRIATSLYFGICGDTGIFRNNNTDSKTFEACAKLLKCGADVRKVYSEFFDKKTVPYIKLTSNALLNAKTNDKYGFAIIKVCIEDYEKFNAPMTENVSSLAHSYLNCGYKIAVTLKEKDDGIHCSFRSKFEYDVASVAETFGGGGHKNASGCIIVSTLKQAEKEVEKAIKTYLENYTKGE